MAKRPPLTFTRTRVGLVPADAHTAAFVETTAIGTEWKAAPLTARSNRQLGLYYSVLREVVDATGKWATASHLHDALKMDLGYRTVVERLDGKSHWIPDSVAFDAMTHDEFGVYFDKAMARLSEVAGWDVLAAYYEMTGQNGRVA